MPWVINKWLENNREDRQKNCVSMTIAFEKRKNKTNDYISKWTFELIVVSKKQLKLFCFI